MSYTRSAKKTNNENLKNGITVRLDAVAFHLSNIRQRFIESLSGLAAPSLASLFMLLRAQTVQFAESEALITMGSYKDPVICLKVMLKDSTHKQHELLENS